MVFFFWPGYNAVWDSKIPHRQTCERVFYCVETSPPSQLPPQEGGRVSVLKSFVSVFIFYILSYLFLKKLDCLSGCLHPPPVFKKVVLWTLFSIQMIFWWICGEEKWSPPPILPPSWDWPSSAHFQLDFFFFCWVVWAVGYYMLDINPLLVKSFANIFSHLIGCLFTLSMVSSDLQKLLCLIRSHWFVSAFISFTLEKKIQKRWYNCVKECIISSFLWQFCTIQS